MNRWSKEEIQFLKDNYSDMTNLELSKTLNKSITAIQHKCTQFGLKKSKEHIHKVWSEVRRCELSSNWKGGKKKSRKGYILLLIPEHPNADSQGYIFEHRVKVEKALGRYLDENEVVHHVNGIKDDNRIENLRVMTKGEHTILHHKGSKRSTETRLKISNGKKRRCINE